jgi:hypothetical protein
MGCGNDMRMIVLDSESVYKDRNQNPVHCWAMILQIKLLHYPTLFFNRNIYVISIHRY